MFTRRTATVTISAPDASTAAAFSSRLLYLPVPTISREREGAARRPSSVSALMSCCAFTQPPPTKCTISKSSPSSTVTSPSVERGTISRLRSTATRSGIEPELAEHLGDADAAGHAAVLAVDADREGSIESH